MRISLSKIRLNGSKTALGSIHTVNQVMGVSSQKEIKPAPAKIIRLGKAPDSIRYRPIGGEVPQVSLRSHVNLPKYNLGNSESFYGMPIKADVNLDAIRLIASRSVRTLNKSSINDSSKQY
jgi:hypothetical protein